jgi:hypothetical protein
MKSFESLLGALAVNTLARCISDKKLRIYGGHTDAKGKDNLVRA